MSPLLIVLSLLGQGAETKTTEKPIPDDFKIVAEYGAGYSDWKSWTATITADGKVKQETVAYPKSTEKEFKLSPEELKELVAAVKKAEFSDLKKDYGAFGVTDQDSMTLEITADKKTHRVYIYGYWLSKDKKDKDDLKRFAKVWQEVLKKVPPPNANQKPEDFDR